MAASHRLRSAVTPYRLVLYVALLILVTVILVRDDVGLMKKPRVIRYVKSSYDWASHPQKHPVPEAEMARLPNGSPFALPKIQHDFSSDRPDMKRLFRSSSSRRQEVKKVFRKTWNSYVRYAWGHDELQPLSLRPRNRFNGWGATLVDSLDTLWMMGLYKEFNKAVEFVATIDWNNSTESRCNLFETNIRYLGGLLAAYDLSGEKVLLDKAVELGDMLYAAFDTPLRFPPFTFSFDELRAGKIQPDPYQSAAAIGSLSVEFTRLAQLTDNPKYYDAIDRIKDAFDRIQDSTLLPGMWPNFINVRDNFLTPNNVFRLGGDGDSLYEYLPKMHALLGGLDPVYEKMYRDAIATAKAHLLYRPMTPEKDDILFLGTAIVDEKRRTVDHFPEMEHLTCFSGGMMAMAGKLFDLPGDVEIGEKLARGCAWAYSAFDSGVMPEKSQLIKCETLDGCEWDEKKWQRQSKNQAPKGYWRVDDRHYLLRPEAIESLFILYRITGKKDLQDLAWDMFQAIEKATATEHAHAVIVDATQSRSRKDDDMESFFLAETLKYFYLIFSEPDFFSLDEWVFNTEAHPLKRPLPA